MRKPLQTIAVVSAAAAILAPTAFGLDVRAVPRQDVRAHVVPRMDVWAVPRVDVYVDVYRSHSHHRGY